MHACWYNHLYALYEIGSNMNIIEGYKSSTRFFALCRSAVTFSSLEKEYVCIIYSLTII